MTQEEVGQERRDDHGPGLGASLKAARVDRGMGVQDAADALHLNVATVEAMESEDWDALPPGPFTRGYLRAYAKLLEIDHVVEQHVGRLVREESAPLRVTAPVETAPQMPRLLARAGVAVIVVGVFGAAGWWFLDRTAPFLSSEPPSEIADPESGVPPVEDVPDAEPPPGDDIADAEEPPVGEDPAALDDDADIELSGEASPGVGDPDLAPGEALGDPEPETGLEDETGTVAELDDDPLFPAEEPESDPLSEELAGGDVVTPESIAPDAPGDAAETEAQPADDEPQPSDLAGEEAPAPDTADASDAETDAGAPLDDPDELVLDFSGPSWMEITDARGEQLLYGLVQEEGEQTLQGEAPFSVVIGDVTQVNVYYEDSAVDLGPEDAGRVVRIQVP